LRPTIFPGPFARRPGLYYPTDMADPRDVLRLVREGEDSSSEGVDSSGVVSSGQSEHALLVAGKITLEEFLDMTVDRALAQVQDQVSSARLQQMREILRAELECDPDLSALAGRAAVGD